MKRLLWPVGLLILALLLLWGLFELFLVYPNVARVGDPLARLKGLDPRPAERIVYRLVEMEGAKNAPRESELLKLLAKNYQVDLNPNFPLSASLGYSRFESISRRALPAPAPAEYRFALEVPAGSRLAFGYGLVSHPDQEARPGVKFQVAVREREQEEVLWEKLVQPRRVFFWEKNPQRMNFYYRYLRAGLRDWGDRWSDASLDLSAFAEKRVELILRTVPLGEGAWPAAFFGDPVVLVERRPEEPAPQNVVLFIVDALSRSVAGSYSPGMKLAPQMDAFAANAVQLDRYFGVGDTTRLGTFPILTGKHFAAMGLAPKMFYMDPAVRDRFYRQHFESFASIFHRAGYQTAMIGANQFVVPTGATGLDLGFDEGMDMGRKYYRTADTMHAAMEWLGQNYTRPFFLYVHFNAPHASEKPSLSYIVKALSRTPGDYRNKYLAYLAEVIYSDDSFGQFLQALEQLGIRDRTLVILTGDHGQTLDPAHFVWTLRENKRPWAADYVHGRTLLAEEIQIPCWLDWPIGPGGGSRVSAPIASMDLLPTVAGLVLPPALRPAPAAVDGRDFSSLIQGQSFAGRDLIYTVSQVGESVVLDGRFHYIRRWPDREAVLLPADGHRLMQILSEQLYDLDQDPEEHRNLAGADPRLLEEMRQLLVQERPREPLLTFLTFNQKPGLVQGNFEVAQSDREQLGQEIPLGGKPEWKVEPVVDQPERLRVSFQLELTAPGQGLILPYSIRDLQLAAPGESSRVWQGPFALNLDGYGLQTRSTFQNPLLRAERNPRFYGDPEGAFLFTMRYSDWVQETFSDRSLSPAVRETLKQWGYID